MTSPAWHELRDREQIAFLKLMDKPSLWAFTVLAGVLGVEEAALACATAKHDQPPEVLQALGSGGWGAHHLPREDSIRSLLRATQITCRRRIKHKEEEDDRYVTRSLKEVCTELEISLGDAFTALRVYESYAGRKALEGVR